VTRTAKPSKSTETMRLSVANIKRLTSLAGKLQMESGKQKTLDDAINYLFDFLEAKNES